MSILRLHWKFILGAYLFLMAGVYGIGKIGILQWHAEHWAGWIILTVVYLWGCWLIFSKKPCNNECGFEESNRGATNLLQDDVPIHSMEEDQLKRGPFVAMLQKLIAMAPTAEGAAVIGVYGKWGDGKTSIRNLLGQADGSSKDKKFIYVDFSPWKYSVAGDARRAMFASMAARMDDIGGIELKRCFEELARHIWLEQTSGALANAHWVFASIGKVFGYSVRRQDEEIKHHLRLCKRKIVVAIDDLDRLSPHEVYELIRFLKANGDLPNVIYLVLADEEYLARAIGKEMAVSGELTELYAGREYLQKIVNYKCYLPAIGRESLSKSLEGHICRLVSDFKVDPQDVKSGLKFATPYLLNKRAEKHIYNEFVIEIAKLKAFFDNTGYLNVHLGDLLALTIMKIFEPEFYNGLLQGYAEIIDSMEGWGDKGIDKARYEQLFMARVDIRHRETVRKFLKECVGIEQDIKSDGGKDMYLAPYLKNPEKMMEYRLASRYTYMNYFLLQSDLPYIPQQELNEFLDSIKRGEVPTEQIKRLADAKLLGVLLFALQGTKLWDTKAVSDVYLRAILHISNIYSADLDLRNYVAACWQQYVTCMKRDLIVQENLWNKQYKRMGEIIFPLLMDNDEIFILWDMIDQDKAYHLDRNTEATLDARFTHDEYDKLTDEFTARMKKLQDQGKVLQNNLGRDLFFLWTELLLNKGDSQEIEHFRLSFENALHNATDASKILKYFETGTGSVYRKQNLIMAVNLDELEKVFGVDAGRTILNTLRNVSAEDPELFIAVRSLEWALDEKAAGRSYGIVAQANYIAKAVNDDAFWGHAAQ